MPTFQTRLVGAQFRPIEAQALVSELKEGSSVYLIRDPDNSFDSDAIEICSSPDGGFDDHLGFVAAKHKDNIALASEIAPFMDLGNYYEARVIGDAGTKSPLIELEIEEGEGE